MLAGVLYSGRNELALDHLPSPPLITSGSESCSLLHRLCGPTILASMGMCSAGRAMGWCCCLRVCNGWVDSNVIAVIGVAVGSVGNSQYSSATS